MLPESEKACRRLSGGSHVKDTPQHAIFISFSKGGRHRPWISGRKRFWHGRVRQVAGKAGGVSQLSDGWRWRWPWHAIGSLVLDRRLELPPRWTNRLGAPPADASSRRPRNPWMPSNAHASLIRALSGPAGAPPNQPQLHPAPFFVSLFAPSSQLEPHKPVHPHPAADGSLMCPALLLARPTNDPALRSNPTSSAAARDIAFEGSPLFLFPVLPTVILHQPLPIVSPHADTYVLLPSLHLSLSHAICPRLLFLLPAILLSKSFPCHSRCTPFVTPTKASTISIRQESLTENKAPFSPCSPIVRLFIVLILVCRSCSGEREGT
jgi:hypothetical protein